MIKKYLPTILFGAFIFGLFFADIILPDKEFSDMENRYLAERPSLSVESVTEGKFMNDYETYVNDQFVLRSDWITVKSVGELALLKTENNDIAYGKDRFMFDKTIIDNSPASRMASNIGYVNEFAQQYPSANIHFSLIPSSAEAYPENLPMALELNDQTQIINDAYTELTPTVTPIDIGAELITAKSDYIYYKTDHHWTTAGAYIAYTSLINTLGGTAVDINTLKPTTVKDFYGTYYSKTKWVLAQPDSLMYYDIPVEKVTIDGVDKDGLYDHNQFEQRDKYAGFLHGNSGLTVINSATKNGKNILLVKDSYAMAMVPFLTYNYENIYMVDLRYYKDTPQLMQDVDFDDIFILYYLINFSTDGNVINLLGV